MQRLPLALHGSGHDVSNGIGVRLGMLGRDNKASARPKTAESLLRKLVADDQSSPTSRLDLWLGMKRSLPCGESLQTCGESLQTIHLNVYYPGVTAHHGHNRWSKTTGMGCTGYGQADVSSNTL